MLGHSHALSGVVTRLRITEGLAVLAAVEAGRVAEFPLHLDLPGGRS